MVVDHSRHRHRVEYDPGPLTPVIGLPRKRVTCLDGTEHVRTFEYGDLECADESEPEDAHEGCLTPASAAALLAVIFMFVLAAVFLGGCDITKPKPGWPPSPSPTPAAESPHPLRSGRQGP